MGVITFNRPRRVATPPLPRGDLLLESPPEIPPPNASKPFGAVLRMLPMLAGGLAMGLMMMGGGGMGGRGALGGVIGGLYGVSMLGMMLSQVGRSNDDQAAQLDANRRDYFRYLAQTRRAVTSTADEQRGRATFLHPEPDTLWTLVGGPRMWERRADAEDFGSVRISVGDQQSAKKITPPEAQPMEDLEPLSTGALRRFIRTHRLIPSVPLSVDLRGFRTIRLVGDEEACRRLAFAMVAQLTTWHAPTDVALMVAAASAHQEAWQWIKWLPHVQHPTETDGVGPLRMFATGAADLSPMAVAAQSAERAPSLMVVVTDGVDGVDASQYETPTTKCVTIEVTGLRDVPRTLGQAVAVYEVRGDSIALHRRTAKNAHAVTPFGRPDSITVLHAEMLARAMAPWRMPLPVAGVISDGEVAEVVFEAPKDYPAMLGVGDPLTLDTRLAWRPRPLRQHLRVPFGTGDDGSVVELDIKESAQGGMGPHGICIGATGSGKSEFLRTLVLGLAMTHSTEQLNFILVDFKGGATFLGLDELPHVSAVITNLEGELSLVDRMADAIGGELDRRMELLRSAGNFKNREDYETARQAGADIPPMPSLLIVVDEFSELLTARPEFIDLFVQIGRVGRSIAVHQLLASQRLEENKLRGLDTFLSYRIALRTFSPAESRAIIGVPDAYELPNPPGNGYLKYDTTGMTRFKAAYVSGPWHGNPSAPDVERDVVVDGVAPESRWVPPVREFSLDYVVPVSPPEPEVDVTVQPLRSVPVDASQSATELELDDAEEDETLLSISVGRLRGHGWPSHKVWLPPLEDPPTMDGLLGSLVEVQGRGLTVEEPSWRGKLRAPVGLIDKPRQQRRDPWWLDFSGSGGNLGVAGGPQSGKSMAMRAAIAGLSLTHTPQEVGFYCLDFGGGALLSMRKLPHMGSVTSRLDEDRVRRTIAEMTSLRSARERQFAAHGIDGMGTYRQARRDGSIPADRFPTDVFFVVDGWATLKAEFELLEPQVQALANGGLGFGIHVWVTASKWGEIRATTKDALQNRIELKLGDTFDSEIDRKIQAIIPTGRPGRGITANSQHALVALPRIDGVEDADDVAVGQRDFIQQAATAWRGPRAAEVRLLPEELSLTMGLPAIAHDPDDRTVPYAVDELELAPVVLNPAADPHMVVIGGPQCGKSNMLRTLLHGITTRYTPKEAKVILVDYRRSFLGEFEGDHLIGYYVSASAATKLLEQAAEAVRARLPGPDVTQQQLRDRSWWKGAEMFVVVDDYELVATGSGNPMAPFADLISQASDIGLHIILARGAGGAGRSMFSDPLITRMKESANPGLIMSGSKDEGALWGDVKASAMPPGRGILTTRTFKGAIQTALYDTPSEAVHG